MNKPHTKVDAAMARIVDDIVNRIESGEVGAPVMPWFSDQAIEIPINATTGTRYRGGNVIVLWLTQLDRGYRRSDWATYKQFQERGAQVRKGETAVQCVRWVEIRIEDENDPDPEKPRRRMVPKVFHLFNVEQVEGWDYEAELGAPADPTPERLAAELAAVPATVVWGQGTASYNAGSDVVNMPAAHAFKSEDAMLATLAHELTHWTGHRTRLERTYGVRFGDSAYAVEELTAELGAAFTCARFGVATGQRDDHAAYIGSWLKVLKADPGALWHVASKAQAASDFLAQFSAAESAA